MGAITSAAIAIAAVVLGWITIEVTCKPCLEQGREAIDRSLNPDYDPDDADNDIRAPLNPAAVTNIQVHGDADVSDDYKPTATGSSIATK